MVVLACVEGGGTTFVVALARNDPTNIVEREEFPTTTPQETIGKCVAWLKTKEYDALGVATFGPVDLEPTSPTYGYITSTPKPGWQNVDVLGPCKAVRPSVPCGFDTDVNAPAVAEFAQAVADAKAKGTTVPTSSCYITVGTGIGVGLVINGQPVHGLLHPEGGHLAVPPFLQDAKDGFVGPNNRDTFGGLCAENMACSGALAKRAKLSSTAGLKDLPDDHPVWDAAAHYLGALCANVVLLASPQKIVLSGGVMLRPCLFPKVRAKTQALLNGYIQAPQLITPEGLAGYIAPSKWGNAAGMVGALTLAQSALSTSKGGASSWVSKQGLYVALAAGAALVAVRMMNAR